MSLVEDEHTCDEVREMATDGYIHYQAHPLNSFRFASLRFASLRFASLRFARRSSLSAKRAKLQQQQKTATPKVGGGNFQLTFSSNKKQQRIKWSMEEVSERSERALRKTSILAT